MRIRGNSSRSNSSTSRNWSDIGYDVLTKIFMYLNVVDLASVSLVSKNWGNASTDRTLWEKFDLSTVSFRSAEKPIVPGAWRDDESSARLTQFLTYALNLANRNTSVLIFHFFVKIQNVHILELANRTPGVKRLVLPSWSDLTKGVIYYAMRSWSGLTSMTIPFTAKPNHILAAIGRYCDNFTELKVTCSFDLKLANALVKHTPKLKVLSIRSIIVNKRGLDCVLNGLAHLEVVNLCHSFLMDHFRGGSPIVYSTAKIPKICNVSHLKALLTCKGGHCIRCKQSATQNPIATGEGPGYLEVLWHEDEISSLAH